MNGLLYQGLVIAVSMVVGFCLRGFFPQETKYLIQTDNDYVEQTTRAFQQNRSLAKSDLLCLVMTQPSNHGKMAKPVKVTWGHRCGTLRFATSQADKDFPELVDLNVRRESSKLQKKLEKGLQYIHKNHFNDADWFLVTNDDAFVVVENLLLMLKAYDPAVATCFGFSKLVPQGLPSGGKGFVLSKEALRKVVEEGLALTNHSKTFCDSVKPKHLSMTDYDLIQNCIMALNMTLAYSQDSQGKSRFFSMMVFSGGLDTLRDSLETYSKHKQKTFFKMWVSNESRALTLNPEAYAVAKTAGSNETLSAVEVSQSDVCKRT